MSRTGGVRALIGRSAATLGAVSLVLGERGRLRSLRAAVTQSRECQARLVIDRDRLRGELSRRQEELSRRERELARRKEELAHRDRLIERLQRSRRAEREWNHELRAQLQRAHVSRGALSGDADVRELVLEAAMKLVGASKGLLLSRREVDVDGDLDVVCARGFPDGAAESPVAQRFAREVIERDRIVREDSPSGDGVQADDGIQNLVAIPLYLLDRFEGVIVCANRGGGFEELEDDVLLALGDHAGAALDSQRLHNQLNESHRAAVEMLSQVIEARDPIAHREAEEAAVLSGMLCRRLDLDDGDREAIAAAALLRDLGHVMVPDRVLLKPGPLSPEERSIVELHPRAGFRVVARAGALGDVASAVLYHHERYDGTGYPAKLSGAAIPLGARVVAIADAFIAMTHDRPYRPARPADEALAELTAASGHQFDPELTQLFLEEMRGAATLMLAPEPANEGDLPRFRDHLTASDPLTLLPGHRAFRERVQQAVDAGQPGTVAIIEVDGVAELNQRDGYLAGDRAILSAARGVQLAAERVGGRAYRDSGRRLAILSLTSGSSPAPDLAAELHIEFALGPPVRIGVASLRPGERGDDIVQRAREALLPMIIAHPEE